MWEVNIHWNATSFGAKFEDGSQISRRPCGLPTSNCKFWIALSIETSGSCRPEWFLCFDTYYHILLSRTTMEVWGSTRDHSGQPKFSTFTAPPLTSNSAPGDSPALQVGLAGLDYPFPGSNCKGGTSLLRTNQCKTSKNQLFQPDGSHVQLIPFLPVTDHTQ